MQSYVKIMSYCIITVIGILFLVGCGHNIHSNNKGVGIDLSWQSENYVPSLKVGYWDNTNAVVRGNSTYTSTTSTGGSLFSSGGTQTTSQLITGMQLNQGNLKEILTSKDNSDQVKIAVIKATMKNKAIKPVPTVAKTVVAAGGTGQNLPEVKPVVTSVDKVVQTAGQVAKTAVPVVGDAYKSTTENLKETIVKFMSSMKVIVIAIVILLLVIAYIVFYIYKKKHSKNIQIKQLNQKK